MVWWRRERVPRSVQCILRIIYEFVVYFDWCFSHSVVVVVVCCRVVRFNFLLFLQHMPHLVALSLSTWCPFECSVFVHMGTSGEYFSKVAWCVCVWSHWTMSVWTTIDATWMSTFVASTTVHRVHSTIEPELCRTEVRNECENGSEAMNGDTQILDKTGWNENNDLKRYVGIGNALEHQ